MIELDNVSVTFGSTKALQSSTLCFRPGLFHVLLGSSGAGKSTLLRCLNQMQKVTSGTVSIDGISNWDNKKALQSLRLKTGMIFQQHQLIGRQSALKNVLMGRYGFHSTLRSLFPLSRRDELIAMQSLHRVNMGDKALSRVDELSGGQQQRVGIARALAQQPKILLADEPVASLDPITADQIMELIYRICQENGLTAVVSLHQVELAKRYADWIVGLSHGQVVFEGCPDSLDAAAISRIYDETPILPEVLKPTAPVISHAPAFWKVQNEEICFNTLLGAGLFDSQLDICYAGYESDSPESCTFTRRERFDNYQKQSAIEGPFGEEAAKENRIDCYDRLLLNDRSYASWTY